MNPTKKAPMRLCYVDGAFAYFTNQELKEQWGDDWGVMPYEYNAGPPYSSTHQDKKPWLLKKVAWDGPLCTPAELAGSNSNYSVEMINNGAIAWLTTPSYRPA